MQSEDRTVEFKSCPVFIFLNLNKYLKPRNLAYTEYMKTVMKTLKPILMILLVTLLFIGCASEPDQTSRISVSVHIPQRDLNSISHIMVSFDDGNFIKTANLKSQPYAKTFELPAGNYTVYATCVLKNGTEVSTNEINIQLSAGATASPITLNMNSPEFLIQGNNTGIAGTPIELKVIEPEKDKAYTWFIDNEPVENNSSISSTLKTNPNLTKGIHNIHATYADTDGKTLKSNTIKYEVTEELIIETHTYEGAVQLKMQPHLACDNPAYSESEHSYRITLWDTNHIGPQYTETTNLDDVLCVLKGGYIRKYKVEMIHAGKVINSTEKNILTTAEDSNDVCIALDKTISGKYNAYILNPNENYTYEWIVDGATHKFPDNYYSHKYKVNLNFYEKGIHTIQVIATDEKGNLHISNTEYFQGIPNVFILTYSEAYPSDTIVAEFRGMEAPNGSSITYKWYASKTSFNDMELIATSTEKKMSNQTERS